MPRCPSSFASRTSCSTVSMSGMIAGITAMPMRRCGSSPHEVGEPPVVRAAPGDRLLDVVGRAGEPGPERRRRDAAGAEHVGIGEQHLRGDAFVVEDRVARGRVVGGGEAAVAAGLLFPLPLELGRRRAAHRLAQFVHRPLVLVEALAEAGVEVVPVDLGRRTGMAVGGDHGVPGHARPPEVLFESNARILPELGPGQASASRPGRPGGIGDQVLGALSGDRGASFDHDYYRDSHVPLATKTWNPTSVEIDKQIDGPYVAAVHFTFESLDAMSTALASEGTAAIGADVPNYTTITPVRQVSEIVSADSA